MEATSKENTSTVEWVINKDRQNDFMQDTVRVGSATLNQIIDEYLNTSKLCARSMHKNVDAGDEEKPDPITGGKYRVDADGLRSQIHNE